MEKLMEAINNPKLLIDKDYSESIYGVLLGLNNCEFVYDGDTYCHISGKIIGKEESIMIDDMTFNKSVLKTQIMGQFRDCFDEEFAIPTTQYKQPIILEFNEQLFQNLLGDGEYQKEKNIVQQKYEDQDLENCLPICPITNNEYLQGTDSFIFQGKTISVEGALEIYKGNPECFLNSQKTYLEALAKREVSQ